MGLNIRKAVRAQTGRSEGTRLDLKKKVEKVASHRPRKAVQRAIAKDKLTRLTPHAEVERIIDLPVMPEISQEEADEVSYDLVLRSEYNAGYRLFRPQAAALVTYQMVGGLFAPIGVGWGKTLISVKIADLAYRKGIKKILLLVPASVYGQLWDRNLKELRAKVNLGVPFHGLGKKAAKARERIAKSGRAGCYISTYSQLSTKTAEDMLEAINPGLIICDEAHRIANQRSARTRRLETFMRNRPVTPELVVLSGTITKKTVMDYWHLMKYALRSYSPLPLSRSMAEDWGQKIDSTIDDYQDAFVETNPLTGLLHWARRNGEPELRSDLEGFRKAYRQRLLTSPGVVTTGESELGVSLLVENIPMPKEAKDRPGYDTLQEHLKDLNELWITPNGDEIEHAMHAYKWAFELSAGFYNELSWPSAAELAGRRSISESEAEDLLERAKMYHAAHQVFSQELRKWLGDSHIRGLDTPLLVRQHMFLHGHDTVPGELYEAWVEMKDLDFDGRPERDSFAVRVSDYKIHAGLQWGEKKVKEGCGGIIWYANIAAGEWMYEALRKAEIPCAYAPAGSKGNEVFLDDNNRGKILVASGNAHKEGKNVQHLFAENLFLQWVRPAGDIEQIIGRTHRNGQVKEEVNVYTFNWLPFDVMNMAATLNDACYIQQTTGTRQKLMIASYNPVPEIAPENVLREMGYEPKHLSAEGWKILADKFVLQT